MSAPPDAPSPRIGGAATAFLTLACVALVVLGLAAAAEWSAPSARGDWLRFTPATLYGSSLVAAAALVALAFALGRARRRLAAWIGAGVLATVVAAWPSPTLYKNPADAIAPPPGLRLLVHVRDALPPWHDPSRIQARRDWLAVRATVRTLSDAIVSSDWPAVCAIVRPSAPRRSGPCVLNAPTWFALETDGSLRRLNRFDTTRDGRTIGVEAWEDDGRGLDVFGGGPENRAFFGFQWRHGRLVVTGFDGPL
jgi:hypothetical protein